MSSLPLKTAMLTTPPVHSCADALRSNLYLTLLQHVQASSAAIISIDAYNHETSVCYLDLLNYSSQLYRVIQELGLAPGSCITVWSRQPLHQLVALISCIVNGMTAHLVNPDISSAMLLGQCLHAQPGLLIVDEHSALPDGMRSLNFLGRPCLYWDQVFDQFEQLDYRDTELVLSCLHLIYGHTGGMLTYKSGMTGKIKGVRMGWEALAENLRAVMPILQYRAGWVSASLLPRFHGFTLLSDILPALIMGGRVLLFDKFDLPSARFMSAAFRHHQVQSYSATPLILDACTALNAWRETPGLEFAVSGLAPLSEQTRLNYTQKFKHPVIPSYGLSEACLAAVSARDAVRPGASGRATGIEIVALDENHIPLPAHHRGELAMRGTSVIEKKYYLDDAGHFQDAFHPDGWFLSGDIGHIDEDGYIYINGRKKNMVIRGSEKIYLEDIDQCLTEYTGVADCATIAISTPGKPDLAISFVVCQTAQHLGEAQLLAYLKTVLTMRHLPDRIYFLRAIPRTSTGTIVVQDLLQLIQQALPKRWPQEKTC